MDQKKKVAIAFGGTIILIAAVIAWMMILNTGSLKVTLAPPYTVKVGKIQKQCEQNLCEIKLNARKYIVSIEKAGYFPLEKEIEIRRWKTLDLSPVLEFIPYIAEEEMEAKKLPDNLIAENEMALALDFEGIPAEWAKAKSVIQNIDGDRLVILKNLMIREMKEGEREERKMEALTAGWGMGKDAVYIQKDGDNAKMYLWKEGAEPELLTQFVTLINPQVFPGKDNVLIRDNETVYTVDIAKKRKEILKKGEVRGIAWNPSHTMALIESEIQELPILLLYEANAEKKLVTLPVQTSLALAFWRNDNEIIFVTFQELNSELQQTFASVGLDAESLSGDQKEALTLKLVKLDVHSLATQILLEIPENISISAIEPEEYGKSIFILTNEGKIRRIRISE